MLEHIDVPARDELDRLQQERVHSVVDRVFSTPIPFFERKFAEAGLTAADIVELADLAKVPTTRKAELRASEAAAPPVGDYRGASLDRAIKLGTSAGTTGRPTITLYTEGDYEAEVMQAHRAFRRIGLTSSDIVVNAHPGYLYGGAQFVGPMIERYGMLNVSLGPPSADDAEVARQLEFLADLQPTVFLGYAPAIMRYREVAAASGKSFPQDYGFRAFVFLEPVCQLDAPRRWFEELFGVDIFISTGMVEIYGFYGSDCTAHAGVHINDDYSYLELLDPDTGKPCAAGERGLITLTTLVRNNVMLRYDSEDVGEIVPGTCSCGEQTTRHIRLGRHADTLMIAGQPILPIDVIAALTAHDELGVEALQFQVVREPAQQDHLAVLLEPPSRSSRSAEAVLADVAAGLTESLGVPTSTYLVDRAPKFTYKPGRIVDPSALASATRLG